MIHLKFIHSFLVSAHLGFAESPNILGTWRGVALTPSPVNFCGKVQEKQLGGRELSDSEEEACVAGAVIHANIWVCLKIVYP